MSYHVLCCGWLSKVAKKHRNLCTFRNCISFVPMQIIKIYLHICSLQKTECGLNIIRLTQVRLSFLWLESPVKRWDTNQGGWNKHEINVRCDRWGHMSCSCPVASYLALFYAHSFSLGLTHPEDYSEGLIVIFSACSGSADCHNIVAQVVTPKTM